MQFEPQRLRISAQQHSNEYLMDQLTIWRDDLEPEAVDILTAELAGRGLGVQELAEHRQAREAAGLERVDGIALRCSFCDRPARERRWGLHRLWGWLPVFPRRWACCAVHGADK